MTKFHCPNCDYEETEPNEIEERHDWRCPQCGAIVSTTILSEREDEMNKLERWTKRELVERIIKTDEELSHYQRLTADLWQAIATELIVVSNPSSLENAKKRGLRTVNETIKSLNHDPNT